MALSDIAARARETHQRPPGNVCTVCHELARIPASEAAGLRELLASGMRYVDISDKIAADPDTPLNLHPDALSRHARGRCDAREQLRG